MMSGPYKNIVVSEVSEVSEVLLHAISCRVDKRKQEGRNAVDDRKKSMGIIIVMRNIEGVLGVRHCDFCHFFSDSGSVVLVRRPEEAVDAV